MAWNPDVNLQDKEGYTPLHLAVRSIESLDSCRPIRALLIKGADSSLCDNKSKTPLDYVNELSTGHIQDEAKSLLEQHRTFKSVIKGLPPVKKVSKNRMTLMVYYILFFLMYNIKLTTIYPRMTVNFILMACCIDLLALFLHILLTCRDPGYI